MMLVAKAVYDNVSESPEELTIRRGDVLTVIEQDTSGLDGWWLCLLKGRRGIVPGNRLKLVDKAALGERDLQRLQDVGSAGGPTMAPPMARVDSERLADNKVVVPQRLGNMFVYDVPSRLSTPNPGNQSDYDIPPARAPVPAPRPSPRGSNSDYDTPVRSTLLEVDHYDVPGSNRSSALPSSNRSSTISMMSTGSNLSSSSPQSSVCESQRSSMDLSTQDTYDVPLPARRVNQHGGMTCPVYDTPKSKYAMKQSKGLEIVEEHYDTLREEEDHYDSIKPSAIIKCDPDKLSQYDLPKPITPVSRHCSADSGISLPSKNLYDSPLHTYDVPTQPGSQRKSVDDDYDTPKSRPVEPDIGVYDVPPRVTKDMGDAPLQEEGNRSSSGSNNSELGPFPYEELRMELTAAMESIVSYQHSLNSACSKLLGYIHPAWRHPDNLEPKVYEVKVSTVALKKAGDPFVQFAQGALVNASKSEDQRLTKKLCSAVQTLSELLDTFSQCLHRLNKDMWPLVRLVRYDDNQPESDDLDIIVDIARQIPESVRSISGLIQGNSQALFRRTSTTPQGTAVANGTSSSASKPKVPPPVKPKPRLSVGNGNGAPVAKFGPKTGDSPPSTAEHDGPRPLPGLPNSDSKSEDQMDYDVPKASKSVESQRVPPEGANRTVTDEYDYVSLTKEKQEKSKSVPPPPPPAAARIEELKDKENEQPVYAQVNKTSHRKAVKSLFPDDSPRDDLKPGLSEKFQKRMEKLQRESEEPVQIYTDDYDVPHSRDSRPVEARESQRKTPSRTPSINIATILPNDRQLLGFYASQVNTHSAILVNAIESFLKCIEEHDSPKTFIAYSKFVILAAHKLVYIGDTLVRHVVHDSIRNDVMNHAYTLCELLKVTVTATKKAALDYPAIGSMQDMVDRVSEVSVAVSGFNNFVAQFGPT